jgi:hypothetical protein
MANFDAELYIETGNGDTFRQKVGVTTDLYFPIWKIAIGQNIEMLQDQRASNVANELTNALITFRQSPQAFEVLTAQEQSLLEAAEAYLVKWHNLCVLHPNTIVRLIGASLVF